MQISLSKDSAVPLHQQLAEQIVFSISTGQIRATRQLPSVRTLARNLKIHHNTVSKAYQDLVRRGWLKRQRGARLSVGAAAHQHPKTIDANLDELINQSIRCAREMGFPLQALRDKVLERLCEQPPDHILVVEHEPELRQIVQAEISSRIAKPVVTCTPEELAKTPELSIGAQVLAPEYLVHLLKPLLSQNQRCGLLTFSGIDEHVALIRGLRNPSVIGMVSVSEALLRTARSLLASVLGQRHTLQECLVTRKGSPDMRGADVVFCDSLAMPVVRCRNKIHYRLIAPACLEDLEAIFEPSVLENNPPTVAKSQRKQSGNTSAKRKTGGRQKALI
ncbi:MAG: transcriptional regulator, GntR family [Acidobacteriaceae bacterium]|nr:transcriptional regulator, GntR family [Acidobacteriaceae bacterium]